MAHVPEVPEDRDDRSLDELKREKLMLEIQRLRQDMVQAQRADRREALKLAITFLAGGAAFLGAAAAFGKLFFGG